MRIFGLLFILCWMCGCGSKTSDSLPVIDFGKAERMDTLKMSEILDNIRIIRFETHPQALLPGYFDVWVGERYILAFTQENILMFSPEGKFLCKLLQQGRGPQEFFIVMRFCVDEKEDLLYLSDANGKIDVVDIKERKMLRKIDAVGSSPQRMLCADGILIYMPNGSFSKRTCYDICRMKPDGTFLGGIPAYQKTGIGGTPYLGEINGTIRYKMDYDDTLYILKDTLKLPYCRFIVPTPFSPEKSKGRLADIVLETKDLFVLREVETVVENVDGNSFSNTNFLGFYTLSKLDFKLKKVTHLYIDNLAYLHYGCPFINVTGKRAYYCMNVSYFKEVMEKNMDHPLISDSVKALYRDLKEDDNPVLLVGDLKD